MKRSFATVIMLAASLALSVSIACAETIKVLKTVVEKKLKMPKSHHSDSVGQGGKNKPEGVTKI